MAEDTGMIVPLGQWVIREACRQLAKWQHRFPRTAPLSMSMNISAKQFAQADLAARLRELLETVQVPPETVELEITESVIMEKEDVAAALLDDLKLLGIKLFIDDFGTGYSSLSYLHRFPIDMLKIDRSFIAAIDATGGHAEIVRAIVGLGRNLGMGLVAEGVETEGQLAVLRSLGCQRAQGYYFSRPLPAREVEAFLDAQWSASARTA